ncbi:MAG: acyl-CoA dehydrogenase family protein [Myxococcales bacterium]|nr:acyl-CoA dehydrogenase family protein [Myxococcales bacterium]MCB9531700.1 acyl-CoA dehydrogenase family protein [Myxococcales bacterium]
MAAHPFDLFNPTPEHLALRETVARWSADRLGPQAVEYDEREELNVELFRRVATELGLFGVTVPEDAGGLGLDATAAVIIHEEMSRYDPAFALSYLAHEVLFVNNLYHSASPSQRERYLPQVIDGRWIAGMAMSEPHAGTDVLGMSTTATRDGDGFRLNGSKQWITNGSCGDVFLVYAKLERDNPRSITSFVVESAWDGFSVGKKERKMGMRQSPTAPLSFDNVYVPAANLLGEPGGALVHMMRNLEIERLTLAAMSCGIALRSVDVLSRYAIEDRTAFGQPLSAFGQIQRFIGESYAKTEAARALVYSVARTLGPESRASLGAASAKLVATMTAEEVARNAVQVLGGYGYTREYDVERLLRDAILLSIGGGTNEAMQKNITADLRRAARGRG